MRGLYLLSNAWGPKAGGINAFNTDFAKALGRALGDRIPVACVVLEAEDRDITDAARSGVKLFHIGKSPTHGDFDPARAYDVANVLGREGLPVDHACWVGNDIISADVALKMREAVSDATVVLIHHMSYIDYQGFKHGEAQAAKAKHDRQRALFAQADRVFGVGPLLRDRLGDLLPSGTPKPGLIIPGLPDVTPRAAPSVFTAYTFGRLDRENDRIKQGRLAVAGFAALVASKDEPGRPPILSLHPQLKLIGISEPGGKEEQRLNAFAQKYAGECAVSLLALPYDEDRQRLLDDLAGSSAAMMLSWHEGFGLTGWEAIGAEVPLILGTNSGLYELIRSKLGGMGLGCVHAINIQGRFDPSASKSDPDDDPINFTDQDVIRVRDALLEIAANSDRARTDAKGLRQLLLEGGCTWEHAAQSFAQDLGLNASPPPVVALIPVPTPPEPPRRAVVDQVPPQSTSATSDASDRAGPSREPSTTGILDIPQRHPEPHAPAALLSESRLLRADTECVPFHAAREPLVLELLDWATDPNGQRVAVQLRVGAGGLGKTRLLRELCHRLNAQDWHAGFLRSTGAPHANALAGLLRAHRNVLVVVDYAETRRETLISLLRAALKSDHAHRLRIMLLARSAGDWWERLKEDHEDLEDFLTGPAVRGPFAVPPVAADVAGREQLYREARAAFARALPAAPGAPVTRGAAPLLPDLSAGHFAQVLLIHLAALASLSGEQPETATALLEAQLRREARYWRQAIADRGLGAGLDAALSQALALITLADGAPGIASTRALIDQAPLLARAMPAEREGILALLKGFYPRDGGVDALRPDLLGERLVARELARDDSLLDGCLGPGAPDRLRQSALTVLNRLAQHDTAAEVWLRMGLARHQGHCTDAVLAVAVESGDPAGRVFAEVLEQVPWKERLAVCDRLHPGLPEKTVVLSELAEAVARFRLQAARRSGDHAPKKAKDRLRLIDRLIVFGGRLRALGRLEEARAALEEALTLAQGSARRGGPAADFSVVTVLTNLCLICRELGAFDDAERYGCGAIKALDRLPNGQWSPQVLKHQRAAVLGNYGSVLARLGNTEDGLAHAEAALAIYRQLAEARPDAYAAHLAVSLTLIGNNLNDLGRYPEALAHAEEALAIYRQLAEARPDAYAMDLAGSLNNIGCFVGDLGRYPKALAHAEEALAIRRRLAEARPDAYAAHLAASLNNVGNRLSDLGRYPEALAYCLESLAIYRQLTSARPLAHRVDLARSLGNLALAALASGQGSDAPASAREATELLEQQSEPLRHASERQLAWVLALDAWASLDNGTTVDAEARVQAAVGIYEDILRKQPTVLPKNAAMAYWIGWRYATSSGDETSAAARAGQALSVVERWIGNGAEALPDYLMGAARELLQAVGYAAATQYPRLTALMSGG